MWETPYLRNKAFVFVCCLLIIQWLNTVATCGLTPSWLTRCVSFLGQSAPHSGSGYQFLPTSTLMADDGHLELVKLLLGHRFCSDFPWWYTWRSPNDGTYQDWNRKYKSRCTDDYWLISMCDGLAEGLRGHTFCFWLTLLRPQAQSNHKIANRSFWYCMLHLFVEETLFAYRNNAVCGRNAHLSSGGQVQNFTRLPQSARLRCLYIGTVLMFS